MLTCIYYGRLFWMWGDTGRPSYPLGNFAMSGAVSDLLVRLLGHGSVHPLARLTRVEGTGSPAFVRLRLLLPEAAAVPPGFERELDR